MLPSQAAKRLVTLVIVLGVILVVVNGVFTPKRFQVHAHVGLVQTTSFTAGSVGGPVSGALAAIRRAANMPTEGA